MNDQTTYKPTLFHLYKWWHECEAHLENCNDENCELYWAFAHFLKDNSLCQAGGDEDPGDIPPELDLVLETLKKGTHILTQRGGTTMVMNYEQWRTFLQSPGAIAVMPYEALTKPCPKCGRHQGYGVTTDHYAYCNACSWGTPTDFAFTNAPYEVLGPDGLPVENDDPGDIPPELDIALERRFEEMCDENPRVYQVDDDDLAQADYEDWQTLQGLGSLAEYYEAVADELLTERD